MTLPDYKNSIDLRQKLAETMEVEIDDACEKNADKWKSRRLGSSQIGLACSRQLWYGFRWAKTEVIGQAGRPAGRVYRLFNRGHREEPYLIEYLKNIGCRFLEPENGEQHTFSDFGDHIVTKLDAIGYMPSKFGIEDKVLFEFKTANLTNFNKMQKNGIIKEQPKYWAQVNFSSLLADIDWICLVLSVRMTMTSISNFIPETMNSQVSWLIKLNMLWPQQHHL